MTDDPFRPRFGALMPYGDDEDRDYDPPMVMADLRDGVDDLPKTAATFTLGGVLDDTPPQVVRDAMTTLIGSWQVPDYYDGGKQGTVRWVNPAYPHRHQFADVFTRCECGALMIRETRSRGDTVFRKEQDHADDCKRSWRLRARARLNEERAERIETILRHGISARSMAPRLGLAEDASDTSIGSISDAMNLDTAAYKAEGKERRLNTECALLTMGYSPAEVGRLWGVSASTIRYRIAEKTEYDLTELYEMDIEP